MTNLCKYKNIFGEPDKGVHKYKLFGFAIVDFIATFVIVWILYMIFKSGDFNLGTYIFLCILAVIISIPIHKMFCVDTKLTNLFK